MHYLLKIWQSPYEVGTIIMPKLQIEKTNRIKYLATQLSVRVRTSMQVSLTQNL